MLFNQVICSKTFLVQGSILKINKKTILIAIPVLFVISYTIACLFAICKGGDIAISIGFLFGFLTMPTSIAINLIAYKLSHGNASLFVQYILIAVAGLINIGIIEGLYIYSKRKKKYDEER
jgi:hypothetical protein